MTEWPAGESQKQFVFCLGRRCSQTREGNITGVVVSVRSHDSPAGGDCQSGITQSIIIECRGIRDANGCAGGSRREARDIVRDDAVVNVDNRRAARSLLSRDSRGSVLSEGRVINAGPYITACKEAGCVPLHNTIGDVDVELCGARGRIDVNTVPGVVDDRSVTYLQKAAANAAISYSVAWTSVLSLNQAIDDEDCRGGHNVHASGTSAGPLDR